ncbi:MAG: hypothetical protein WCJ30_10980 [Deltaproteobacteria bacterium]
MTFRTSQTSPIALVTLAALSAACGASTQATRGSTPTASTSSSSLAPVDEGSHLPSRPIVLPGGPGRVGMDFLGYDAAAHTVWIPAGNTGRVDVLDTTNGSVRTVDGFATTEIEGHNGRRVVGPSSVAIGEGVVFVGNRADSQICPIDPRTLQRGECATVESPPDGIVLVPTAHQLWVTLPRIHALAMLRVNGMSRPTLDARLALDGSPEGYAVDPVAGIFYTNLEDRNRTLAIDIHTRVVVSDWPSGCDAEGPRGLAIDTTRHQLFVACTDGVVALDLAHGGAVLSTVATGGGVDLIDFLAARHLLFVGSAATAMLRVVSVDERGAMRVVASGATAPGGRNAVVDEQGRSYVADSAGGRIFVVDAAPQH